MTVAKRLADIRAHMKLSQTAMAEAVGVKRDTWRRYEAGDTPSGEPLERLIDLGFSCDWILKGRGEMLMSSVGQKALKHEHSGCADGNLLFLPRHAVQGSDGFGLAIHSEQIVDYVAFQKSYVRDRLGADPGHLFMLEASGDSMAPTIVSGDLLLVRHTSDGFRDNAIYIFMHDEQVIVKRVERRLTGGVVIRSDNPRYYPEVLTAEEAESLRVIGQVIWHGGVL